MNHTDPSPTESRKKAGNYRKKKIRWNGLDISIENPAGSMRSGTDSKGKKWQSYMPHDYGYIRGTKGKDGDHVDVFIGPHPKSELVTVINQVDPKTRKFDEHKCMLGFFTKKEAVEAYLSAYEKGWKGLGSASTMSLDQFKRWVRSGRKMGPVQFVEKDTFPIQFKSGLREYREGQPLEFPVRVSPKLDGVRATATKDGLRTKSGKPVAGQKKVEKALSPTFRKNPEAKIEGELYRHGKHLQRIVSDAMTGKPLKFHPFPGSGVRRSRGPVKPIREQTAKTQKQLDRLYRRSLRKGYEGVVIHAPDASLKRKPIQDREYPVAGATLGKKKGVFTLRNDDGRTFKVQGPSGEVARATGKQATVVYRGLTPAGIPTGANVKVIRDYAARRKPVEFGFLSRTGNLGWKSQKALMDPSDFLKKAAPLKKAHGTAVEKYRKMIREGKDIDMPFLRVRRDGSGIGAHPGNFRVYGHEGRHRMIAARAEGMKKVPVEIESIDEPRVPKRSALLTKGLGMPRHFRPEQRVRFAARIDIRNLTMKGRLTQFSSRAGLQPEEERRDRRIQTAINTAGVAGSIGIGLYGLRTAREAGRAARKGQDILGSIQKNIDPILSNAKATSKNAASITRNVRKQMVGARLAKRGLRRSANPKNWTTGKWVNRLIKGATRGRLKLFVSRNGSVIEFRVPTEEEIQRKYRPVLGSRGMLKENLKDRDSIRTVADDVPRASSYREVIKAAKEQGVGPVKRHAAAAQTRIPVWSGKNASFLPDGKKGVIISSRKVNPSVMKHEAGHAADYKRLGGKKGFKREYGKLSDKLLSPISRKHYIRTTMLPEERAWAAAGKTDEDLKREALRSYANAGPNKLFMTARGPVINFRAYREWDGKTGINPDTGKFEDNRSTVRKSLPNILGSALIAGAGLALLHRGRSRVPIPKGSHAMAGTMFEPAAAREVREKAVAAAMKKRAKKAATKKTARKQTRRRNIPPVNGGIRGSSRNLSARLHGVTEFNLRNPDYDNRFAPSLDPRSAYRKAQTTRRWANRAGEVGRDVDDMISGRPRDPKKKRFHEKSWFRNAVATAAIAAPIIASRQLARTRKVIPALNRLGKVGKGINKNHARGFPLFAARNGRIINLSTYADSYQTRAQGWDLRDGRGNSARVFAPGSKKRVRRQKEPHERVDHIRRTRNYAVLVAALGSGLGVAGLATNPRVTARILRRTRKSKGNITPFKAPKMA